MSIAINNGCTGLLKCGLVTETSDSLISYRPIDADIKCDEINNTAAINCF